MDQKMDDELAKKIALLMAANCVRNTVIEDYHAKGKITQAEMKEFNKEVVNKLYTFWKYFTTDSQKEYENFMTVMSMCYPIKWDEPKFDNDFVKAVEMLENMQTNNLSSKEV